MTRLLRQAWALYSHGALLDSLSPWQVVRVTLHQPLAGGDATVLLTIVWLRCATSDTARVPVPVQDDLGRLLTVRRSP